TGLGANGITISHATSFVDASINGLSAMANDTGSGIKSVDPELAARLNNLTDDSNVDAIIVYHQKPTDADLTDLVNIGVLGGTHSDLSGRVVQNVKLADTQSVSVAFTAPVSVENLPTTDQADGHGTFVAGLIAGNGTRSGGKYAGIAPGANVVGLSAGDLNLS